MVMPGWSQQKEDTYLLTYFRSGSKKFTGLQNDKLSIEQSRKHSPNSFYIQTCYTVDQNDNGLICSICLIELPYKVIFKNMKTVGC